MVSVGSTVMKKKKILTKQIVPLSLVSILIDKEMKDALNTSSTLSTHNIPIVNDAKYSAYRYQSFMSYVHGKMSLTILDI